MLAKPTANSWSESNSTSLHQTQCGSHPGRCLVDVLRRRDEHDPGLFQSQMDRHVISAVTSEPIDLVNDAVGDLVGLDVLDHPDQVRTVCPAGGFTRVDELLDDDGIQLTCLAKIRLSTS